MISYTSDNEFFKGKIESFSVARFLLELTQHMPPRGLQYIRRYGLYSSRTKSKCTWARLIAQVYEIDALECPRCHSPMNVIAVITDPEEVKKILLMLVPLGAQPLLWLTVNISRSR